MKKVEKAAKTVEEAVELALKDLNVTREKVEIEVLDEATKGFFGVFGVKPARVLVTVIEVKPNQFVEKILADIFKTMDLEVKIDFEIRKEHTIVNLTGEDLGILIGRRGETLDSLQYLVNLSVNRKQENRVRFILDVEGYRKRREETLQNLAHRLADKVRKKRRDVILEPMNPQERRIIHTTLQNENDISTFSEGEEPYRKIVISLKNTR